MGKQGPWSWPPLVVLQGSSKKPPPLGTVIEAVVLDVADVAAVAPLNAVVKAAVVAVAAPRDAVV
jgi:hypothetical protein